MGKGENAGHKHFLPFPLCFKRPSSKMTHYHGRNE